MNTREQFIANMTFQVSDRTLLWELGYWTHTLRRWYKESLPKKKGVVPNSALDSETTTGEVIASLGLENLCIAYYDNPTPIQEMVNFLTDFWRRLWIRVLQEVEVDFVLFWEDMCYKNGPLISPEHFRQFMLPGYKKLISLFRLFAIKVIFVDTDGNYTQLIPPFIEGGVTGMLPFMLRKGGYVPCADYLIPPDVSWENFLYYRRRIKKFVQNSMRL